jgi:aquaporin Z
MNAKALIAEFIGTFAIVFFGVGAIATNYMLTGGKTTDLVAIALAHGLIFAAMVSATVAISGGHLNPAITFGVWLARKIDLKNAVGYIIFQCLGGIFAASLLKLAFPLETLRAIKMGTPTLGEGETIPMALVMELIMTFFLVFVYFGTLLDARSPKVGGLFIGAIVALDILAGGPLSAAVMNPARYLGPALLSLQLQQFWLYWIGPLVGAAAAALLYHYFFEERGSRLVRPGEGEEVASM